MRGDVNSGDDRRGTLFGFEITTPADQRPPPGKAEPTICGLGPRKGTVMGMGAGAGAVPTPLGPMRPRLPTEMGLAPAPEQAALVVVRPGATPEMKRRPARLELCLESDDLDVAEDMDPSTPSVRHTPSSRGRRARRVRPPMIAAAALAAVAAAAAVGYAERDLLLALQPGDVLGWSATSSTHLTGAKLPSVTRFMAPAGSAKTPPQDGSPRDHRPQHPAPK
jgi:hypothetical protein